MNNSTIFILLLLVTVFIPTGSSAIDAQTMSIDVDRASGYVAFIVNSQKSEQDEETNSGPNPDVKKCVCKGTGKITHGDGHQTDCPYHSDTGSLPLPPPPSDEASEPIKTTCQCDSVRNGTVCNCVAVHGKCYCQKFSYKKKAKTAPASPSLPVKSNKQILFFTAEWCPPCQKFKDVDIPLLKAAGYSCGTSKESEIRIVDTDVDTDGLYEKYGKRRPLPSFVLIKDGKEVQAIIGRGVIVQGEGKPNLRAVDQVSNMWNDN